MHTRFTHLICIAFLLASYAVLAITSSRHKSPTIDEPYFLLGGVSSIKYLDNRLQFGNGPLPQMLQAAPAILLAGYNPHLEELPAFQSNTDLPLLRQTLFAPGIDYSRLFFLARLVNITLGLALGLAIYFFARRAYGPSAGLLALALYAFSPTLIAHASLATSDIAATLFFTLSTGCFWMLLQKATPMRLLGLCLSVSALFVTKFSSGLFIPLGLAMIAASILLRSQWRIALPGCRTVLRKPLARVSLALGIFALSGLVAWAAIWAGYGFRYEGAQPTLPGAVFKSPEEWKKNQALLTPSKALLIQTLRDHRLMPEVYIYGLSHILNYSTRRPAYLLGTLYPRPQPAYFPVAWALKTPPTLILIQAGALFMALLSWARLLRGKRYKKLLTRLHRAAPWWLLLAIVGVASITSGINIGIRHILPVLPPSLILAGSLAIHLKRPRRPSPNPADSAPAPANVPMPPLSKFVLALLLLTALDTLLAWPNYINYYTPLVGGASQGYKYLGDSNTDWGQDLPSLADYASARDLHAVADDTPGPDGIPRRLYFSYFGAIPLPAAGIDCAPLYCFFYDQQELNPKTPFLPGYYAFSATQLLRLYTSVRTWDEKTQAIYEHLDNAFATLDALDAHSPEAAQARVALGQPEDLARRNLHFLRSLRLAIFLNQEPPDDQINGSINIYFLDPARLQRYLHGQPPYGLQ